MTTTLTEIHCERVLAPSGINLGDYVINPYRGCSIGCRYCYVQKNKAIQKRHAPWGSFVDVKINAPTILRKELQSKKVNHVLIGSTTEVYQPCEERYGLMRELVSILNDYDVAYTILTKSSLIVRDVDVLKKGRETEIYFTVSPLTKAICDVLEPHSLPFHKRIATVTALIEAGIKTRVYVNPVIPHVVNPEEIMKMFSGIVSFLDFEGINVKMLNWDELRSVLRQCCNDRLSMIDAVCSHENIWNRYWDELRSAIVEMNKKYDYSIRTFFHPFSSYFGVLNY
ncbi:MAG: radical SAM protein [Candidatus Omnitrophica bacterium]|nr:radical SAM protein [Candidatus Omnitrophota bacterium]